MTRITDGRPVQGHCADRGGHCPGLDDAERTRCEIWTRVMGYHRPVAAFNAGKRAEHAERLHFRERPDCIDPHQETTL